MLSIYLRNTHILTLKVTREREEEEEEEEETTTTTTTTRWTLSSKLLGISSKLSEDWIKIHEALSLCSSKLW